MTPQEVIDLLSTPDTLMRKVNLVIVGGATRSPTLPNAAPPPANGQAEEATFKVVVRQETALGFTTGFSGLLGRQKNRVIARIERLAGPASQPPPQDHFNAYYVPMVQTSDVAGGTSHYTLPMAGGPDIMITSQLSGCTFGVGSDAQDALLVSHVQPDNTIQDASQRAADLAGSVRQGFAGVRAMVTSGRSYENYAAIIGVRSPISGNGSRLIWRFYLQGYHKTGTHRNVVTRAKKI